MTRFAPHIHSHTFGKFLIVFAVLGVFFAEIARAQSVPDDTENCDSLRFHIEYSQSLDDWKQVYDSSMRFIQTCYDDPWAPLIFQSFTAALQPLAGEDTSLWLSSRQWLESVLYLNTTNPEYFCKCMEAIEATFHSPSDTSETLYWEDENRAFSIEEWVLQNTTCDSLVTVQEGLTRRA